MQKFLYLSELILFWLVVFLLAFIPLYPKFPLFNVKGTFVAIRLEDLLIGLTISYWFFYILISGKFKAILADRINQAILLFFLIGAISVVSGLLLTQTVTFNLGLLHFLRRVEFVLLLPVVASVIKTKKQLLISLSVLSVVLLAVNIYALGQQYLRWPVISTTNSEFSKGLILYLTPGARVSSTFAGHYDLAIFLAMSLIILVALFFAFKNLFVKGWIMLLTIFSSVILVMTAARLSFIAAVAGILFALFFTKKKKYIALLFIIGLAILVYPSQLRDRFISTVTVNLLDRGARFMAVNEKQAKRQQLNIPTLSTPTSTMAAESNRFATHSSTLASDITPGEPTDSTELGVFRSFEIRLNIEWPKALNAFYKNPILGTGYSSLGLASDNDYLRSLGEVGLFGTIAFALILLALGKRIYKNLTMEDKFLRYFSAGLLSILLAFLINALFIDVFEASKAASLFWMLLGTGVAIEKFRK
ncbi:O-antigen ligase family protein [Candidatus Daviesbacteria bacterium]|nr:O-antigen ligase family protein [Candidatus Daviesbacteria bacterium]